MILAVGGVHPMVWTHVKVASNSGSGLPGGIFASVCHANLMYGVLQVNPESTDSLNRLMKTGPGRSIQTGQVPGLGPADIPGACPGADDAGYPASMMGQIAAGLAIPAIELGRRDGQLQEVKK